MTKTCPRCRKTYSEQIEACPDDGATLAVARPLSSATAAALEDDYRIIDWLGSGGMGAVYIAEQVRVGNRKVALKLLHRRFSEDHEFTTRFQNEAASTGRINHPNVITIYESKQASDGTLYIAMELVEGESLTERLRQGGPLAVPEAVEIASQCCKALQAAHRLGIIHRDIKPDNVMLARDVDGALQVKILDFGIAKLKDSGGHTVTGSVLGTPAYMSYEQASGLSSEKLDGRSDVYSIGLVTYAMLVGHPPFQADSPVGYITKHLAEAPPPIRPQRAEVPVALEVAVMRAIEKDRERRHQTAGDFATALRAALNAPPVPPVTAPGPVASPPRREPGVERARTPAQPAPVPRRTPVRPIAPEGSLWPAGHGTASGRASARATEPGPPAVSPQGMASEVARRRMAMAAGVVRRIVSWGMGAYVVVFFLLFLWQMADEFFPTAVLRPLVFVGWPVLRGVAQWVPRLTVGRLDLLPLILAVALFMIRPYLAAALGGLEARWRGGAAPGDGGR